MITHRVLTIHLRWGIKLAATWGRFGMDPFNYSKGSGSVAEATKSLNGVFGLAQPHILLANPAGSQQRVCMGSGFVEEKRK